MFRFLHFDVADVELFDPPSPTVVICGDGHHSLSPVIAETFRLEINGCVVDALKDLSLHQICTLYGGFSAVIHLVLSLFNGDDAEELHYENSAHGTIAQAAAIDEPSTWEDIFVPDGSTSTISQLRKTHGLSFDVRNAAYAQLLGSLTQFRGSGVFEIHTTVTARGGRHSAQYVSDCAALHLKPIIIELPQGTHRVQYQSSRYVPTDFAGALLVAAEIAASLAQRGYVVTRTKIECALNHPAVPASDGDGAQWPRKYVEFHVKVGVPAARVAELEALFATDAHCKTSRNARKVHRDTGLQERFVNIRLFGTGREEGMRQLQRRLTLLQEHAFDVQSVAREYAVYDDHLEIDGGWL